jgi:hypothetical protein
MMSIPSNVGAVPGATPPAAPISGMPMPAAPAAPAMPQVASPPVAAPAGKSVNMLLIVIFCLLAFLAGGVVVYLVVRRG